MQRNPSFTKPILSSPCRHIWVHESHASDQYGSSDLQYAIVERHPLQPLHLPTAASMVGVFSSSPLPEEDTDGILSVTSPASGLRFMFNLENTIYLILLWYFLKTLALFFHIINQSPNSKNPRPRFRDPFPFTSEVEQLKGDMSIPSNKMAPSPMKAAENKVPKSPTSVKKKIPQSPDSVKKHASKPSTDSIGKNTPEPPRVSKTPSVQSAVHSVSDTAQTPTPTPARRIVKKKSTITPDQGKDQAPESPKRVPKKPSVTPSPELEKAELPKVDKPDQIKKVQDTTGSATDPAKKMVKKKKKIVPAPGAVNTDKPDTPTVDKPDIPKSQADKPSLPAAPVDKPDLPIDANKGDEVKEKADEAGDAPKKIIKKKKKLIPQTDDKPDIPSSKSPDAPDIPETPVDKPDASSAKDLDGLKGPEAPVEKPKDPVNVPGNVDDVKQQTHQASEAPKKILKKKKKIIAQNTDERPNLSSASNDKTPTAPEAPTEKPEAPDTSALEKQDPADNSKIGESKQLKDAQEKATGALDSAKETEKENKVASDPEPESELEEMDPVPEPESEELDEEESGEEEADNSVKEYSSAGKYSCYQITKCLINSQQKIPKMLRTRKFVVKNLKMSVVKSSMKKTKKKKTKRKKKK